MCTAVTTGPTQKKILSKTKHIDSYVIPKTPETRNNIILIYTILIPHLIHGPLPPLPLLTLPLSHLI